MTSPQHRGTSGSAGPCLARGLWSAGGFPLVTREEKLTSTASSLRPPGTKPLSGTPQCSIITRLPCSGRGMEEVEKRDFQNGFQTHFRTPRWFKNKIETVSAKKRRYMKTPQHAGRLVEQMAATCYEACIIYSGLDIMRFNRIRWQLGFGI